MNKVRAILKNPGLIIVYLGTKGFFKNIPDDKYISLIYHIRTGKKLNLKNPVTFNEKLQWLKLHDRNPLYTRMVDKYEAKKYVADIIGEEYIIPTLGVWNHFDEIDFDSLPSQFVLKCTHDSGGLVIVKDKEHFDKAVAKKKIEKCLKRNFFWAGREWPYKNVTPRIIAEEYMTDMGKSELTNTDELEELKDYKIFCFDGKARFLFVGTDRQKPGEDVKFDFYDTEFQHLPIRQGHQNASKPIKKPDSFELMIDLAERLSKGMCNARIDFYDCGGKPYFGEITLYHFSGMESFVPDKWDKIFGAYINLPI